MVVPIAPPDSPSTNFEKVVFSADKCSEFRRGNLRQWKLGVCKQLRRLVTPLHAAVHED